MALFGLFKSAKKPPAAPNYQQVQQKQAEADTETTQQQSQLNNPNQVNPFGTQTTTYDDTGTPTVTQKLTDDSQSALTAQQQTQKMLAESGAAAAKRYQDMISQPFNPNLPGIQTSFNQGGNIMSDPNQMGAFNKSASGDFTGGNITNDPNTDRFGEASGSYQGGNIMLDSGMSRYGDASGNFTGQQARTDLDLSNVAKMPVNAGMTGQQAIMSRLDPQIQRMDERARQRLANQGLTYGGEAYNRAMSDVNQSSNDLLSQAALQGIGLDMSANQQGYNQALSSGGFYNQGVGQNYQQGMGSQAARNQALGQNQQAALANQQSLNQAQQQQYGQGMDTQAARNAAISQNKQEALARSQFANQAQQQGFSQGMSRQDAMNAAIGQNQSSALARQQAMNQGQQQQFNQDLARAQFGNTAQDQSLNQQLQLRQQPLNEVMGLMGGSQIQLPQFQGYQAANKSPQEIMLAQQMSDKALMDRYGIESSNINARNSAVAGLIGSVYGGAKEAAGKLATGGFSGG